ncbi:hypothetical protein NQ314_005567 [Rhamnusium bicolor]|uniref:Dolichyl-diphosphooligosaccharide--protein glycosyltransferase subunit 1 n=1 Tax=Rhamnusium bicolor TaxID=1586634 RepID=A0AAV8ZHY7_9CUCU|nr:hypothetical protein NQ314_005567 [Rhamnusium bicolor]
MYKILALLLCLTYVTALEKVNNQLINKNVERSIDLTTQLVKITSTITLENTGRESVRNFLLVLEPNTVGNVSYSNVKDSLKDDLKIVRIEVDNQKDKTFYNVLLKQPLDAGRVTTVVLEEVLTKSLIPFPSSITQKEKQLKTEVSLSSRTVENYTKLKPVVQSDSTITYGPYGTIQPFTQDEMIIHYENNAPFLTVTRLERSIEISHWGNIAVEENIQIRHTGAKLKGPFSRYDYQRDTGTAHHSIKSYRTILPASAHSVYYRDSNGNISTSTVRPRKEWIELELRPRFPLFGGWQSSYTLGYSVPSYQYLFKNPSGEYVLNMRIIDHVFDDMHVEELETAIVLPVGVSDIKLNTPYEVERLGDEITYKYLDNIGRTVIKLRKTNLVEQHIQDLEITYNWKPHLLLHEPILLSIALFLSFVCVIIYVRLDFSLSKSEHSKKE